MADDDLHEMLLDYKRSVVEEFRANKGKCGGGFEGNPMLLLTVTGARSGRRLTSPLSYTPLDDDFIVFASAGGQPTHPQWYFNLVANPGVEIEVGTESFAATATVLEGDERERAYTAMTTALPRFGEYQAAVEREIPVIRLRRKG